MHVAPGLHLSVQKKTIFFTQLQCSTKKLNSHCKKHVLNSHKSIINHKQKNKYVNKCQHHNILILSSHHNIVVFQRYKMFPLSTRRTCLPCNSWRAAPLANRSLKSNSQLWNAKTQCFKCFAVLYLQDRMNIVCVIGIALILSCHCSSQHTAIECIAIPSMSLSHWQYASVPPSHSVP